MVWNKKEEFLSTHVDKSSSSIFIYIFCCLIETDSIVYNIYFGHK